MKNNKVTFITQAAMIAAIYVVLTVLFKPFGFGEIQVRISEALTILPFFTPAAIPGLFIGCLLANLLAGGIIADVIFGSIATLIGACLTYLLRNKKPVFAPLPPIIANIIIVPPILVYGYGVPLPVPLVMLTVGVGEILSCGVLGMILLHELTKYKHVLFKNAL